MEIITIGNKKGQEVSLRKDIEGIFGVSERNPKPANHNTLEDHLRDGCLGYLDEENEECQNHCSMRAVCGKVRNELFKQIADKLEAEDDEMMEIDSYTSKIEEVKERRKKKSAFDDVLSEWANQ